MKNNDKYKVSNFYIESDYRDGKKIVFSTLTTSIIVLDMETYNNIYIHKDLSKLNDNMISDLKRMGFILNRTENEVEKLNEYRKQRIFENDGMKSIIIAPTMECNARCYYCFENGAKKYEKMTLDTAEALVKFIDENCHMRKISILWFGGEPLLADHIIDFIAKKLKEKGVEVSSAITTNGLLVNEEIISKSLKEWNITRYQITLDGLEREYNRIKNYSDKSVINPFEVVITNIEKLLKHDILVKIRINFDPSNPKSAEELLAYLENRFGKSEHLYIYVAAIDSISVKSVRDNFTKETEHPYMYLLKKTDDYNDLFLSNACEKDILRRFWLHPVPYSCEAEKNNIFTVGPRGDLYKCHRLLGRPEKYNCGNVFNGVIKSHSFKYFCSSEYTYDKCSDCNLLPLCQGGCKAREIAFENGSACMPTKAIVSKLLRHYVENY